MIIIGIAGKKHSGKDEVCKAIQDYCVAHNLKGIRIAFADECKADICRLCCVSLDFLEAHKEHFRLIMQGYGTDFRRWQREDYWIQRYLNKINEYQHLDVIVTPDVRFENEMDCIKNRKGFLIKVVRKQFELGGHKEVPIIQEKDTHASETSIDHRTDFDCEIDNSGTIEQLHKEVKLKLEMYKILCINRPTAKH